MIPIFKDDGTRLTIAYNGLNLNVENDAADDTYEINTIVTGDSTQLTLEPRPEDDGSELAGEVHKQLKIIRIDGTLRAPTIAKFMDKRQALAVAFDAAKINHEYPTTTERDLTFSVPTTDTVTYPTGLITSKYKVIPKKVSLPAISQYTGNAGFFTLELYALDPKRYFTSQSTIQVVGSGSTKLNNTKANIWSWPTITIAIAGGSASSTYTVYNNSSGMTDLQLNLSAYSSGTVQVNMATKEITRNGALTPSLWVSGDFFKIEPFSVVDASIVVANGTNTTTTTGWYPAFVD